MNTGGVEDSYVATLKVDGEVHEDKEIAISAGSSTTVTFKVTFNTPGSHRVGIEGLSEVIEVLPLYQSGTNWSLVGGLIAAATVLPTTVFLARQKIRGKGISFNI